MALEPPACQCFLKRKGSQQRLPGERQLCFRYNNCKWYCLLTCSCSFKEKKLFFTCWSLYTSRKTLYSFSEVTVIWRYKVYISVSEVHAVLWDHFGWKPKISGIVGRDKTLPSVAEISKIHHLTLRNALLPRRSLFPSSASGFSLFLSIFPLLGAALLLFLSNLK